jgi:hypothetical protein
MDIFGFPIDIVALCGVIVAIFALVFTLNQQNKSFNSNIILNITESFSDPKMNLAMKDLKKSEKLKKDEIEKELKYFNFDNNRRMVTHHFFKIYLLYESGVINKKLLRIVAQKEDVELLINCVERIEKINNEHYNRSMFDLYRSLLKKGFYNKGFIKEFITLHLTRFG